jgi:hypothetical protein
MHWVPIFIGNNNYTCFGQSFCPSSGASQPYNGTGIVYAARWPSRINWTSAVVGWEAPDDGQKDCPKRVDLLLPIKIGTRCICWFYLQGICHDARSYNPKISDKYFCNSHCFKISFNPTYQNNFRISAYVHSALSFSSHNTTKLRKTDPFLFWDTIQTFVWRETQKYNQHSMSLAAWA